MSPRALLIVEPAALEVAQMVAAGLKAEGVTAAITDFDSADVGTHETADLVVLGGLASTYRGEAGSMLRGWLARNRAAHPDQLAAAFDLRHGSIGARHEATAFRALRAMSSRGFRLATMPVTFSVKGSTGLPGHERDRGLRWGGTLGEIAQMSRGRAPLLVGSGQRH